ncbi:MAG TPA: cysteine synthase family protein [Candidatus Krumholzibacteria bacterium]|nr:cysteine synthase family protein [Candidatus Krumholzibacteria bacterium]
MSDRLRHVNYAETVLDTIGNTPLIKLNRVTEGVACTVLAKLEQFNPGGSVKDRIGIHMIRAEAEKGTLKPGGTIVECTSGNTGLGLALAASILGYQCVFTMPDKVPLEKEYMLKAYGAEVIRCPTNVAPESPESYYSVAKRLVKERPNAILGNQYQNPMNPDAHYRSTGPEIWKDTEGEIDYFVAGVGTGGTISGTGRYLKEQNPKVKVIGVDPVGSLLTHYFHTRELIEAHQYLVDGIGEDFVPSTCQFQYVDDMIQVGDRESLIMTRRLAREEGLLVGSSSGAVLVGALQVARDLDADKIMVVLIPDTGERYLSKVHSEPWLAEHGLSGK